GRYSIPLYDSHSLINYKCAKIAKFSAGDVMESFFNSAFFFKEKIVLLGRTDPASKDFINTPVPSGRIFETLPMLGVEVWKEAIDMILQENFLYRLSLLPLFLILLVSGIAISAVTSYSNRSGAALTTGILLLSLFAFYAFFLKYNLVAPLLHIAILCFATYLAAFSCNYANKLAVQKRLETELEFAHAIQQRFLPHDFPRDDNFSISAATYPARVVGGDFYDVFRLDDQRVGFLIGDVSGKGIPAALFMAKTLSYLRTLSQKYAGTDDPSLILKELNSSLCSENVDGMFVTLIQGIFFPKEQRIVLASAGHPYPYFYSSKEGKWEKVALENGPPAGAVKEAAYRNAAVHLHSKDKIIFMTDAFLETFDAKGNDFIPGAFSRLTGDLASASAVSEAIMREFRRFIAAPDLPDDATLLIINC
ncbi:SpoIIE family protein phosphatase, partial [Omnitrophica bacterium]|nr:SpoIIE family protein phosphatase [Candidatus Omnitrophota bacterium]